MAARTAIVWGASGGMGSALVRKLKGANFNVQAIARDINRIPKEADEKFHFDTNDFSTFSSTKSGNSSSIFPGGKKEEKNKSVDLMIYAAGSIHADSLDNYNIEKYLDVLHSNVTGPFLATQSSIPFMKEGGHIMFIGAYVSHLVFPKMGIQASVKGALEPLVATWAKENRKLKFSIVRPGPVDTDFWKSAPIKLPKNAKHPDAVADAILKHFEQGKGGDLDL